MKWLIILFIALLPVAGFAQNGFPDYWTVVNKFFSLYHHEPSNEETMCFAKKKDGWHVELLNRFRGDSLISSQLFWSKQKGRYQVLENFVGASNDPLQTKAFAFINTGLYAAYGYDRCIYYGYNGWDMDLMKDFENATIQNDTLLEGLARAYGAYASRHLWYQYGGANTSNNPLQSKLGRLELPGDERVKIVAGYIGKAAETYQKLYEKNKRYETMVGNIAMKCFNENFHGYVQLMMCNRPEEAAVFLSRSRLPVNDSIAAANLLNSIEKNGIIFSYGDNDTYPPLYLQQKHHYRKDVTILNLSMLGFAPYLEWQRRENSVSFSTRPAEYGNPDIEYSFYYPEKEDLRKQRLSQFVAGYKRLKKVAAVGVDSVKVYDVKNLFMLLADTINIPLGNYITMSDFMVLDIVNENTGKRPIYFTRADPPYFKGYIVRSGTAYRLHNKAFDFSKGDSSEFNHLQNFITNVYRPPFVEFNGYSSEYISNTHYHFDLYLPLFFYYDKWAKPGEKKKLTEQCFASFGNNAPYVPYPEEIISILCENGFETLADKVAETQIKVIEKWSREKQEPAYYDKEVPRTQLNNLKKVLEKYDRNAGAVNAALSRLGS